MTCGELPEGVPGESPAQSSMIRKRDMRRVEKGKCQRCREAKSMFIIRNSTSCAPCFEANLYARFTRQLYPPLHSGEVAKNPAKRNLYRPKRLQTYAALALSGGAGSMAMLEMLVRGDFVGTGDTVNAAEKRRGEKDVIWPRAYIVYVEFAGVVEGGEDRMEFMRGVAEKRKLEFVGLRAEDVFDPELRKRLGDKNASGESMAVDLQDPNLPVSYIASSTCTPLEKLRTLVASLPPPSRPALLSNILHSILSTAASTLPNVSHLLIGETATRQAQRVISGTASGRGWALPRELARSVELPEGIIRMSPMKDVSLKEAAFACRIRRLECVNQRNWGKAGGEGKRDARGKGGAMSIEGLTEQFIAGLSVTHPSTVSTINRTGDKLHFAGRNQESLCPLCQMPVDPSALEWKNRTALTSLSKTPQPSPSFQTTDAGSVLHLAPKLCYACLTTLTPPTHSKARAANGSVEMPLWVGERVSVSRASMKAHIGEFLLNE